jgi:HTH-type transcriptional regulator/antitoxin HigA
MIKNEKQYKISKKKLKEIVLKIIEIKKDSSNDRLRNDLILATYTNLKKDIEKEISKYEKIKSNPNNINTERDITELPRLIIEYKIAAGLTHKEFSKRLGLKEQQLQRHEAQNFKGVSFNNLIKYLDIIGLDIRIKGSKRRPFKITRLRKHN